MIAPHACGSRRASRPPAAPERPRGLSDREWIEHLLAVNAQLREAMVPAIVVPAAWGLTPAQTRVLSALLARAPHLTTTEMLLVACEAPGSDELPQRAIVKVHVSRIRAALAEHVPCAVIENRKGHGYLIPIGPAASIKLAIARGLSAEPEWNNA